MEDSLRPTGNMERYNIARTHLKFYNKVQVAATYTAPRSILPKSSQDSTGFHNLMYSALTQVLNVQPILKVTIEDDGAREPKWLPLGTIDLAELVKFVDENPAANPDSWIQAGHHKFLDRIGVLPLWRVIVAVLEAPFATTNDATDSLCFTVAFYCHHAIGDGLSCAAFHLTLLDALNDIVDNPDMISPTTSISVKQQPLPPNLEMATPLPVTSLFALWKIFTTYIYNPEDRLEWSGPPVTSSPPVKGPEGIQSSFSLEPDAVKRLAGRCREEKSSVTALIAVLVARKLGQTYPTHSHFTGTIPFSLRNFTGHTDRDMGVFVSNIQSCFSSEASPPRGYISCRQSCISLDRKPSDSTARDEQLWHSARACKKLIQEGSTTTNTSVGMLKFVSDLPKLFLGRLGQKRDRAFEVSNIGVIDGGVKSNVEGGMNTRRVTFDRIGFSGSVQTSGEPYAIAVATAKNGFMSVAVRWETGVISNGEGLEMKRALEKGLRDQGA